MNKVFLVSLTLVLAFVLSSASLKTTGFILGDAEVSITDTLAGRLTGFDYKSSMEMTEIQNITAEFTNVGSLPFISRTEITVYFYNGTRLDPTAYYYDSYVNLQPGQKRVFKASFTPSYYGNYYIKARVSYDTKVTETWGSFSVVYIFPPVPPIIIIVPPQGEPVWTYNIEDTGTPRLSLEYQRNHTVNPGQSLLISMNAKNIGTADILNLRLSTSATSLISADVNPKALSGLGLNTSNVFLISLVINKDTPIGLYPLNFEFIGDRILERGTISLNVTPILVSLKDEVYQTMLNYAYLIGELENEISEDRMNEIDVTDAEGSLEKARISLGNARNYYGSGDYEGARDELDNVKKDLEDVVFKLANAKLLLQVTPAFSPFWILIILVLLAILFLYMSRRKKKPMKRPKMFSGISEET